MISDKVRQLMANGVKIPVPASVEIGDTVAIDRISGGGVTLHPGTRIMGSQTVICDGACIGEETPATVDNCQVGPKVRLKGGYYAGAVFLHGAQVGSAAHIRPGTILEERASAAHAVGLKQTILFPYVTLGSLINFCDVFMAGGTGPRHHSEVGSSYIHFNFTPNQDKATASLIGDVPMGVMLDQEPIFLGGQGGLVGPCRLAYGTIIAAGAIYRKDALNAGRLITAGGGRSGSTPFTAGIYRSVKRVVANNTIYLANLLALSQWYQHVRKPFVSGSADVALWNGLQSALDLNIAAHVRQFGGLVGKLPFSIDSLRQGKPSEALNRLIGQQEELVARWPDMMAVIDRCKEYPGDTALRDRFAAVVDEKRQAATDYLEAIHALDDPAKSLGRGWLQSIVDHVVATLQGQLPGLFGGAPTQ